MQKSEDNSDHHFIVLGAGASFDFLPENFMNHSEKIMWETWRPPLVTEIINPARFQDVLSKHEEVLGLSGVLMAALNRGEDLEEYLQENVTKDTSQTTQIISLLYYLGDLFSEISNRFDYKKPNNYTSLIEKIKRTKKRACIVTFNYDTLLDSCLGLVSKEGDDFLHIDDYIERDIKLIKMHGSCNWSHFFVLDEYENRSVTEDHENNIESYLIKNHKYFSSLVADNGLTNPGLEPSRNFRREQNSKYIHSFPALAIPAREKHEPICPKRHINSLESLLKNVSKILIIGWKAADENLLKIFKESIENRDVEITLVLGRAVKGWENKKDREIELVKKRISEYLPNAIFPKEHNPAKGFTDYMNEEDVNMFFK